jgi:hypothetical protein
MSDFTVTTYAKTKDELGKLVATLASDGFSFVVEANGKGAAVVEPAKPKQTAESRNDTKEVHCVYKREPKPGTRHSFNVFRDSYKIGDNLTLESFIDHLKAEGYKPSSGSPCISRLKFGGYIVKNDHGGYTRVK